jgi:Uma2 family endonuclease
MRVVLVRVSESELAERRRLGLDRRDEMWEGVLHMTPAPSDEHQRIVDDLIEYLRRWLRKAGRGVLRSEIRSPDDETYEKLPFFARIGVRELLVIDRDSKRPEIFRLAGPQYVGLAADREGWLTSEALSIRLRAREAELALEEIEDPDLPATI